MASYSWCVSMDNTLRKSGSSLSVVPTTCQTRRFHASLSYIVHFFIPNHDRSLTDYSTHEALNNATYNDCSKEISFNRVWLQHSGISSARYYSPAGLIPPAITGMHNADAIKAWLDNGIKFVVGDNTRNPLINHVSFNLLSLLTHCLT